MDSSSHGREAKPRGTYRAPRRWLLLIALLTVAGVWWFRGNLNQWIAQRGTLANEAPVPENLAEAIQKARDPRAALLAAWNTGRIIHREVAVRILEQVAGKNLTPELESVLVTGALDPDMSVREMALSQLSVRQHPRLGELAAAQLKDIDPKVRLLGLQHLRSVPAAAGLPVAMQLLDDPDPFVAGTALKRIETWSGRDFELKLADLVPTGEVYSTEAFQKLRDAAAAVKEWWALNREQFQTSPPPFSTRSLPAPPSYPAGDFALRSIEGKRVRLSDFRGRPVLLNFWATWCTACLKETPILIALQNIVGEEAKILGISLDFFPHGHGEHRDDGHEHGVEAEHGKERAAGVREKVMRTVKSRGINYTILLDEKSTVGPRFNGGELPTTVLVDAAGNVRRRFVGDRPLAVLESMIREAQTPPAPAAAAR